MRCRRNADTRHLSILGAGGVEVREIGRLRVGPSFNRLPNLDEDSDIENGDDGQRQEEHGRTLDHIRQRTKIEPLSTERSVIVIDDELPHCDVPYPERESDHPWQRVDDDCLAL